MENICHMRILTEELFDLTRESRQDLLGNIRHMQNQASISEGEWCQYICVNSSTLLFLKNLFHVSEVNVLESIFATGKFIEDESIGDGVINFKKN